MIEHSLKILARRGSPPLHLSVSSVHLSVSSLHFSLSALFLSPQSAHFSSTPITFLCQLTSHHLFLSTHFFSPLFQRTSFLSVSSLHLSISTLHFSVSSLHLSLSADLPSPLFAGFIHLSLSTHITYFCQFTSLCQLMLPLFVSSLCLSLSAHFASHQTIEINLFKQISFKGFDNYAFHVTVHVMVGNTPK